MGTLAQLDCVPRSSRKEHKMQRRSDLTAAEKKAWGRTTFHKDEAEFKINWLHAFILTWTPALALYGAFTTELRLPTLALAVFFYFFTGMGITAGYHRLFSHKAYRAHWTVRLALALAGAGAFQGSAKWWCRNHRAHHRFTDTDKDPYNVRKGFWWAHLGWMLSQQDYSRSGFADITDIKSDRILAWQHKYYGPIGLFVSVILPTAIAALWGDGLGWLLLRLDGAHRLCAPRDLLCQLAGPLLGRPAVFADLIELRLVHHRPAHPGRGLPQLPPRLPDRLPQRHPVVAL